MRTISLDILKVFLAILVVIIHMRFLNDTSLWEEQLVVNGICRIAVPLFLMISGYYFISVNTKEKLLQWCKRVIIMYLIWSVLYCFVWISNAFWQNTMVNLLFGYAHLWYLVGVMFGALLLFFLRDWKYLPHSLIASFIVGYVVQFEVITGKIDYGIYNIHLYRNFLFFAFPFLGIGYLLSKWKFHKKYNPSFWYVCLAFVLMLVESFGYFERIGRVTELDLLLSNMLLCPLLFLFILNKKVLGHSKYIAVFSTAIYLVHPFVLKLFTGVSRLEVDFVVQKVIVFLLVFAISGAVVMLNNKLKYLL